MTRSCHNTAGPHRPGPSGEPIRADELLPWSALHTRLGWGSRAVAEAQRRGLRVLVYAKRKYILGRDVIDFLERHGQQGGTAVEEQSGR
jgi:hypothetical protein